jgi:hypothetical protein
MNLESDLHILIPLLDPFASASHDVNSKGSRAGAEPSYETQKGTTWVHEGKLQSQHCDPRRTKPAHEDLKMVKPDNEVIEYIAQNPERMFLHLY